MMAGIRRLVGRVLRAGEAARRVASPPGPAQGGSGTLPPPPKGNRSLPQASSTLVPEPPAPTLADDCWSLEAEVKAQERARERAVQEVAQEAAQDVPASPCPAPVRYDVRPAQGHDGPEWVLYLHTATAGYRQVGRFAQKQDAETCCWLLGWMTRASERLADIRTLTVDVGDGVGEDGVKARVG